MCAKSLRLAIGFYLFCCCSSGIAGVVNGVLGPAAVNTGLQTVSLPYTVTFNADGEVSEFSIDVVQSAYDNGSGNLLFSDYSFFSFERNSGLTALASWTVTDFGASRSIYTDSAGTSTSVLDVTDGQSLLLGHLVLDYSNLGLQGGDSITIDLAGQQLPFPGPGLGDDIVSTNVKITTAGGLNGTETSYVATANDTSGTVGTQMVILPAESATVPEPASIAVWALLGFVAIGVRRHSRKKPAVEASDGDPRRVDEMARLAANRLRPHGPGHRNSHHRGESRGKFGSSNANDRISADGMTFIIVSWQPCLRTA